MKIAADFFAVWGGIAGVQSTLAVLLESDLPPAQIAELTAGYPARRFSLPHKGGITVGNDADLTLVDMQQSYTLEAAGLFQKHPISPYLGRTFRGAIRRTILRGTTIFQEGRVTVKSGGEIFAPRDNIYATSWIYRSANRADHLLLTPDTFVRAPSRHDEATAIVHAAPAIGAGFAIHRGVRAWRLVGLAARSAFHLCWKAR